MAPRIGLVAILVVAALGSWLLLADRGSHGSHPDALRRAGGAAQAPGEPGAPEVFPAHSEPRRAEASRETLAAETAGEAAPAAAAPPPRDKRPLERAPVHRVAGRVLDAGGQPLAQVEVHAAGSPQKVLAHSLGDGSFELETNLARLELEGQRPGWCVVRAALVEREHASREAIIVLAPAVALAGQVIDPEGSGIPRAGLRLDEVDWLGIAGFPLALDHTVPRAFTGSSDDAGSFDLAAVPRLPGRYLVVTAEGHEPARLEVPASSRSDLEVRLARSAPDPDAEPSLFGSVRLPDGSPAAGARVQQAKLVTTTDRDGRFELVGGEEVSSDALLVALLDG